MSTDDRNGEKKPDRLGDAVQAALRVDTHPTEVLRLVLYCENGRARASLYPFDANAFSAPLCSFPLKPDQELPRLAPGAPVQVEGSLEKGEQAVIHAGQVDILVPAKGRTTSAAGRIFGLPNTPTSRSVLDGTGVDGLVQSLRAGDS